MHNSSLTIQDRVYSVEKEFNQVNAYKMNFAKEALFALQKLRENQFLADTASRDPASLEYALINIASIGISLNSALSEAFLVPRGGKVVLDISYRGLIKLATDTGAVEWVQAEIVKKNDKFTYNGIGKAPSHEVDYFGDRGETVGVYCVAKLSTGESLSTIMSRAECDAIRDKSSAAKKGPWVDHYEEMLKKCVIKRAAKLWPRSERVSQAIEVLNEHEGIDFSNTKTPHVDAESFLNADPTEAELEALEEKMNDANRTSGELLKYLNGRFPKDALESFKQFNGAHMAEAHKALDSIIAKQKAK